MAFRSITNKYTVNKQERLKGIINQNSWRDWIKLQHLSVKTTVVKE